MDERIEKATKELAGAVADKSKEAFEKAKNMAENIDTEEINKNVKEISRKTKKELEKHSKKAKNASSGIAAFWKKLSKRNKIIVTVVGIVIICGLFSGGKSAISGGGKVTSKKGGEKLLREILPSGEYTIQCQGDRDVGDIYFNVDVGQLCSEGGRNSTSLHVYIYDVNINKGTPEYRYGVYWVAEDGRVVGEGSLVSEALPTEFIRIR